MSQPAVGSRAQVMHGNAKHTSGGLKKSDLKYNKQGRIVSIDASAAAKKSKNLGSSQIPKGSHKFALGGADALPNCKKGRRCGRTCISKKDKCYL
jgi:hypothetical protein